MTDLEIIKAMLEKKGIAYLVVSGKHGQTILSVERGYVGFYTQFVFEADGSFEDVGAYE